MAYYTFQERFMILKDITENGFKKGRITEEEQEWEEDEEEEEEEEVILDIFRRQT